MNKDYGSERFFFENRITRPCHRQVNEEIFDFFFQLSRESKILDVGCGDGFFLFFLRELGFIDIKGVDVCPSFIIRCREKILNAEMVDIIEYKTDKKFDLITLIELLEHVKEPEAVLKHVNGLLKENGQILITVPILDSLSSKWSRLRKKTTRLSQCQAIDETHLNAFTRNLIFAIIVKAGFIVKKWSYCYNPLPYRFRKILSSRTYDTLSRITLFNTCGDSLFIVAEKPKR